jgi:hypothetical protein
MNTNEIVKVSLDIAFGNEQKKSLTEFINKALDDGEYFDGFEIAISKNELDYKEFEELYDAFNSAYSKDIPNIELIRKLVDEHLPQSYFTQTSWLVSDLGEIYATDGLRVAKIYKNKLIWITKRVSYDGINLINLTEQEILGQWYSPIDDDSPWSELRLSTKDGALLKGEVIEF